MKFNGLKECLNRKKEYFNAKIEYNKNRFENEEKMFNDIKGEFSKKYDKKVYIYNDDDKSSKSSCDMNDINIGYSRYLNRIDYVWEYAFNVTYPE